MAWDNMTRLAVHDPELAQSVNGERVKSFRERPSRETSRPTCKNELRHTATHLRHFFKGKSPCKKQAPDHLCS